jgi:nucleoside-diphosphate-sugar epimerase
LIIKSSTEKIKNQQFNVGYQNLSMTEIAKIVKKVVNKEFNDKPEIDLVFTKSNDNRSYHICSDKVKNILGFQPKYTIEDAVKELCDHFKKGEFKNSFDDDKYFNVQRLKKIQAK